MSTAAERLVVIGGDAAGMSAASQAHRLRPDLEIVAFERNPHTSYSACGMPYYIDVLIAEADDLIARSPAEFERRGIQARVLHEVESINTAGRSVTVRDLVADRVTTVAFDQLVIATGAVAARPPIPGIDADGVYTLGILQDGIRIREAVDRDHPTRAVIIGGGYIGVEMAEALVGRGITVTMVDRAPEVMLSTLDPDVAALVSQAVRDAGITLHLDERIEEIALRDGRVAGVQTSSTLLPADLVIVGTGIRPNTRIAAEAGIELGNSGGIIVDDRMHTGTEGIWAAGDCVETMHMLTQRPVHIALGTVANKTGRVCGINLGGGDVRFPGVLGTAITKFFDTEIARTGLSEREAHDAGIDYSAGMVQSTTRAGYYPGAREMWVKLLAERGSGRLLGGQIVGGPGAGKRIDTIATAVAAGITAAELEYLDLSYAPPFSPVWDPVQIAARKAAAST